MLSKIMKHPLSAILLGALQELGEKVQGLSACVFLQIWGEACLYGKSAWGLTLTDVKPRTTQINSNLLDLLNTLSLIGTSWGKHLCETLTSRRPKAPALQG